MRHLHESGKASQIIQSPWWDKSKHRHRTNHNRHAYKSLCCHAFPSMDVVQERRSIIKRNDTRGILFASMHRTSHGCVSRPPIRLMMMNVKSTLLVLLWSIQYHFQLDSDQWQLNIRRTRKKNRKSNHWWDCVCFYKFGWSNTQRPRWTVSVSSTHIVEQNIAVRLVCSAGVRQLNSENLYYAQIILKLLQYEKLFAFYALRFACLPCFFFCLFSPVIGRFMI